MTNKEWFEEEPNTIEAKGTFSKDQMAALCHAVWQTVLKYHLLTSFLVINL